jgi:hypothetical protein
MPERAMPEASQPPATPHVHGERRKKVVSTLKLEIEKLLVRILFLWIMFGLFELYHTIILAKEHVDYSLHGFALVNAIVMSKVLLIAEELNFAHRFHESRLIYSILYKSLLFSLLFLVIHVVEDTIKGLVGGHDLVASLPHPANFYVVLCSAAILFTALTPYFAYREVARVMGEDKLRDMIFKRRTVG